MNVIKRDGTIQEFVVEKIRLSILNASIDGKNIINESDLKILSSEIVKKITELRGNEGVTSSYEIIAITMEVLAKDGFSDIAKEYVTFNK